MSDTPGQPDHFRTLETLVTAALDLRETLSRRLADEGIDLSPLQMRVLRLALARPGMTQKQVVADTGLDKGLVARTLKAFETRGLIERREDPANRRVRLVKGTPAGKRLRDKFIAIEVKMAEEVFSPSSAEDIARMEAVLTRVHERVLAGAGARKG